MDVKKPFTERVAAELVPHEPAHLPQHSPLAEAPIEGQKDTLDIEDFTDIPRNRGLRDLEKLSPAEQDQIAQYWGQSDLRQIPDEELSSLQQHVQSVLANKRSGYSPVAWLSKAVGGRPYLENLERLHGNVGTEISRRKEEKLRPYRELDASLRALNGPDDGQRSEHLAAAKSALRQLGKEPFPDFLKGSDATPLHLAFSSGDPELIESAIRHLSDKSVDGHELLYEPDASGRAPTSYLGQDAKYASALLALKDVGFDPARLGEHDQAQFLFTRDEIAKNLALNAFMKPGHYWLALGLANSAFKSGDESARTARDLVGGTTQYDKPLQELAGKGDPGFWPEGTGTTPLHLLVRSNDANGVRNLGRAFGNAWVTSKDSQGKLASDYATTPEMKEALRQAALAKTARK